MANLVINPEKHVGQVLTFVDLETERFVATASVDDEEQILKQAMELEEAIGDVMNGKLKPAKLPVEPMVRLIAFAKVKLLGSP